MKLDCKACRLNTNLDCPNGYDDEGMQCCRCQRPQYSHVCDKSEFKRGWDEAMSVKEHVGRKY